MRFDTDAPAKQDVFPALEKGTRAAFAAVVPQLSEGFLEDSTPTPLRSVPWRTPLDRVVHHSVILELNVKSYCAEAAHQRKHRKRTDKTGDANEA